MSAKEIDPYKKVWNSVEDHESDITEWAKNGTLFVPTWEEMAHRHASKARYLLAQARKYGRTNPEQGKEVFEEALIHVRMAKRSMETSRMILERSR